MADRQMITRNNITEVAYNVQTTVDEKHNLPIDYKITNTNDSKAMGNMLQRAKSILRTNEFSALYDKGYHTGSEFKIADDLGIDVMVAIAEHPYGTIKRQWGFITSSQKNTRNAQVLMWD